MLHYNIFGVRSGIALRLAKKRKEEREKEVLRNKNELSNQGQSNKFNR
jgi:hypothetical protein